MIAIVSDIHANLEALQVVLDDLNRRRVDRIYCLGDTVGYGPDPEACVSLVRNFDVVLRGSFDDQVLVDHPDMLSKLRELAGWARKRLSVNSREFLATCPTGRSDELGTFSHGSPPNNDYLFPEDVHDKDKMKRVFDSFEGVFFCGHSHIAGVHTQAEFIAPDTVGYRYKLDSTKVVVNVGSAGQPRDGDKRACYVLVQDQVVEFVRLEYDVETTKQKLRDAGFGPSYWDI